MLFVGSVSPKTGVKTGTRKLAKQNDPMPQYGTLLRTKGIHFSASRDLLRNLRHTHSTLCSWFSAFHWIVLLVMHECDKYQ